MKKVLSVIYLLFIVQQLPAQNQGINNLWITGYNGWSQTLPFGNTLLDFYTGAPVIIHSYLEMEFKHTFSSISDAQGNLLFYTNGVYVADATHDTMMNGSGLNPSAYTSNNLDGLAIPQGALILPLPGSNNLYYVFHSTCDQPPLGFCVAYQLYYSIVDMSLNNNKGAITQKNTTVINDTLSAGKIAAVKHANGRDWWIIANKIHSNLYYKILFTPNGIEGVYIQNIGIIRNFNAGQAWFSPDGSKYAHYYYIDGLVLFDYDRCTGVLSNQTQISFPQFGVNVGLSFSPNSEILYVSNVRRLYQVDLNAANIALSVDTIAFYDGFVDSFPPWPAFGTFFGNAILAPDGKIYISTGNGTHYLHTIDNPDLLGTNCNVNQHSFNLTAYNFNTLPNHPNYFLGKIPGSPCDTVVDVGWEEPPDIKVGVYPNPNNGVFTLSYPAKDKAGLLELYDVNGRQVHREEIAPWSQFKRVESAPLSKGIYFCRLRWGSAEGNVKILIE